MSVLVGQGPLNDSRSRQRMCFASLDTVTPPGPPLLLLCCVVVLHSTATTTTKYVKAPPNACVTVAQLKPASSTTSSDNNATTKHTTMNHFFPYRPLVFASLLCLAFRNMEADAIRTAPGLQSLVGPPTCCQKAGQCSSRTWDSCLRFLQFTTTTNCGDR